ncbi:head GIN domain-containing protein [Flavobacterium sp.]|uniref:head GIN domain-containing protein n=1 Tax=Flavobacterium sp. TaxID=239 RepID=UPI0037C0A474
MKNTIKLVALFVSILLLSCNEQFTGIQGSGNITKEKRNIEAPFTAIVSDSGVSVIVAQESTASIEVETDDNIQQYITTKIENGTLYIKVEGSINTQSPINVSVKMPSINGLEASSGSTIHSKDRLKGMSLSLKTSSGSKIEVAIEFEKVTCDASSGSSIAISGKALSIQTSSSSGSEIDAKELAANEIVADASSGSFTKVKPIIKLNGTASSGSTITYYQSPKTLIKTESSGGSVTED